MQYIALIAVIAILLLQFSGAVPDSSVGGPMTLALVFLGAAMAVGVHEAWTNKRGVLGWIVNIPVSLVGAFLAAEVGNLLVIPILMLLQILGLSNLEGSLAATGGLLLYASLAGMMLLMLLGSWLALQFVNRWR
ncbi:hypothetical protein [Hyphomicrobium sp.]|uniref:hypothetical protein n=1 Tax=Hyphomicrobium sp. TaxID=82 RepID=UPI0025C2ADA1|nr:hypothetical protein [Hyphomicrobium sp.]MCC7251004.1 hypothetical protein [Hyphomicrobium sp.]